MARLITLGVILAGIWFAVMGGEYSTIDLVRQHTTHRRIEREIDSLKTVNDSLQRAIRAVATDPATQERIAREEFGMVRGREILYRFAEPRDSTRRR